MGATDAASDPTVEVWLQPERFGSAPPPQIAISIERDEIVHPLTTPGQLIGVTVVMPTNVTVYNVGNPADPFSA